MRVKTLHAPDLIAHSQMLEEIVSRDYVPDLIIGIENGGARVAESMFEGITHKSVRCRRPSSESKDRATRTMELIRSLPEWLRNFLRMTEAALLSLKRTNRLVPPVELPADLLKGAKKILVVDDAVDSGTTLLAVLTALRYQPGEREIKSAVLTVTTNNPVETADYSIYNNRTLLRFPWSKDYRPEK